MCRHLRGAAGVGFGDGGAEEIMRRVGLVILALWPLACQRTDPAVVDRLPAGGTDVTLFVAADTHFGYEGIPELNKLQIAAMNGLPGMPYPAQIGGAVARPRGVLIAGDLTEKGAADQWRQFVAHYGLTGKDGMLQYPVYECRGNHDRGLFSQPVLDGVKKRHGRLTYSMDFDDLHVVCLDLYPDAAILSWLRSDLAAVGRTLPVVIYFHYSIEGPFSDWWSRREKDAFAEAIEGFNVVGIFHGHYHGSQHYRWRGYDVYNVGSPRHGMQSFAVLSVSDARMSVASWNWSRRRWQWVHAKPINAPQPTTAGSRPGPAAAARP